MRYKSIFGLVRFRWITRDLSKKNCQVSLVVLPHFWQEKLEKMALELLWTEESKQKLLEAARNVIEKYGFAIELADVQLMQDKMEIVDAIETAVHLHLTEKMETDILDALAGYLKESVMGQSPVLSEEE